MLLLQYYLLNIKNEKLASAILQWLHDVSFFINLGTYLLASTFLFKSFCHYFSVAQVREIQQRQNPRITHWQVEAMAALQEAAEAYIVRFLEDCNEAAMFCNRVTVMKKDFQFINRLRGKYGCV